MTARRSAALARLWNGGKIVENVAGPVSLSAWPFQQMAGRAGAIPCVPRLHRFRCGFTRRLRHSSSQCKPGLPLLRRDMPLWVVSTSFGFNMAGCGVVGK